ncbi:MAG: helix-turn-helix transcriptional regulator [Clostridia bacterium]|nr:helix-turn-helix transcriptional regulator [Clostridia bacterium]
MLGSKVFKKYLILFISVALLACTLAGFLLMQLSSQAMDKAAEAELQKRWSTAANDYSAQIKKLSELALRVSFEYDCNPAVVRESVINELGLLKVLGKYDQASQWNESIVLYYPQDDVLFTSGAKYHSYYFAAYLLKAPDASALMQQIENAEWGQWITPNDTSSLLVFPLKLVNSSERMYCLYLVSHDQIAAQAAFVSALTSGIAPADEPLPPEAMLISRSDAFTLWVSEDDSFASSRQSLIGLSVVLIAVLCTVFVGVAVVLAYQCYRPIRQLTDRFLSGTALSGNELESLSTTLNQAINDKHYSQNLLMEQIHRMDEQKDTFRRQLLLLLLNGQTEFITGDMLSEVGIYLPGPFYTLFAVDQSEPVPFQEMKKLVKELSDDNMSFYAVATDSGVVVLCSMNDRTLLPEAVDMLNAVGEANGHPLTVRASQICTALDQLPALLSALNAGDNVQPDEQETPRWYDDGSLNVIFAAIRQGRAETAREQMQLLIHSISQRHMPDTLQRCAYIDIFNRLIQCALDARLPVPGELSGQLLETTDEEGVIRLFEQVIDKMTHTQSASPAGENNASAFVNYVDEHACDISFNINSMTDVFGLSAKYIARQIREQVGMPYRNYIIHLRIKEACRRLRSTDTPVSEIHERVGYSSASHFVKVFRTVTGMTPSAYRLDGYMLSSDAIRLDVLEDMDA